MEVFIARQPVFDRNRRVFGYELLYRSGEKNAYTGTDGNAASSRVILDGIHGIGLDTLTLGTKAFINFPDAFLLKDYATILPKNKVIVEILEDTRAGEPLVQHCKELKKEGYTLALDDFVLHHGFGPLIELADIIKVDYKGTNYSERRRILNQNRHGRVKFLAEKVETLDEFHEAHAMGFSLFQGYYFARPLIIKGKDIDPSKLNYIRLINRINQEEPDFGKIAEVIEHDLSLSYKLLRLVNSAAFGFRTQVRSIRQAVVTLGIKEACKWATLMAMKGLSGEGNDEVMRSSLLRAKMMESLAIKAGMTEQAPEIFMMGLFSMMDVLLNKPMEEILDSLPLTASVKRGLLGERSRYGDIMNIVLSYEQGLWNEVEAYSKKIGLAAETLSKSYTSAIHWVRILEEEH